MQSLFDFYKSNKSYTSAGVTDEHSYFLTNAGRLGRLKLENVGGEKPLSTLHSSCGSSQSASLQVPKDAQEFDFSSETWKFKSAEVYRAAFATNSHDLGYISAISRLFLGLRARAGSQAQRWIEGDISKAAEQTRRR